MPFQTDLLDDLRRFDVPVIEIDGWRTRGRSTLTPKVGVNHHTAGGRVGPAPSLYICTNGRGGPSPVPGPLCNVLLGRDGVARLIAAGVSNNAGRGGWLGISGNSNTLGLEVEHVGTLAEPVPQELIDLMARIQAAFAWERYDADHVCQHFEWTTRKIDFVEGAVPGIYTPAGFRSTVRNYLNQGGAKPPTPPIPPGDDLMAAKDDIIAAVEKVKPFAVRASKTGSGMVKGDVWVVSPTGKYHTDRATLSTLYFTGAIRADKNQQPALVDPANLADIPVLVPR